MPKESSSSIDIFDFYKFYFIVFHGPSRHVQLHMLGARLRYRSSDALRSRFDFRIVVRDRTGKDIPIRRENSRRDFLSVQRRRRSVFLLHICREGGGTISSLSSGPRRLRRTIRVKMGSGGFEPRRRLALSATHRVHLSELSKA